MMMAAMEEMMMAAMEEMMMAAMEDKIDNPNVLSGYKEQHFSHPVFSLLSFILIFYDIM
jgi:hypothetical protein